MIFKFKKSLLLKLTGYILIFLLICFLATLSSGCTKGSINSSGFDIGYKVYVPNISTNTLTVLPAEDSGNTSEILLDNSPNFVAQVPGRNEVWVLLQGTNEIARINTVEDEIIDIFRLEVGSSTPQSNNRLLFSPDGQKAFITTSYDLADIAIVNVADQSMIAGINLDSTAIDNMFLSASGDLLYLTDPGSKRIYIIDTVTNALAQKIDLPEGFSKATFNQVTGRFHLSDTGSTGNIKEFNPVTQLYGNTVEDVVNNILKMEISPDGNLLYALGDNELVTVNLDENIIEDRIDLDYHTPSDIKITPDRKYILIPSSGQGVLMVLNFEDYQLEDYFEVGNSPGEIAVIQLDL